MRLRWALTLPVLLASACGGEDPPVAYATGGARIKVRTLSFAGGATWALGLHDSDRNTDCNLRGLDATELDGALAVPGAKARCIPVVAEPVTERVLFDDVDCFSEFDSPVFLPSDDVTLGLVDSVDACAEPDRRVVVLGQRRAAYDAVGGMCVVVDEVREAGTALPEDTFAAVTLESSGTGRVRRMDWVGADGSRIFAGAYDTERTASVEPLTADDERERWLPTAVSAPRHTVGEACADRVFVADPDPCRPVPGWVRDDSSSGCAAAASVFEVGAPLPATPVSVGPAGRCEVDASVDAEARRLDVADAASPATGFVAVARVERVQGDGQVTRVVTLDGEEDDAPIVARALRDEGFGPCVPRFVEGGWRCVPAPVPGRADLFSDLGCAAAIWARTLDPCARGKPSAGSTEGTAGPVFFEILDGIPSPDRVFEMGPSGCEPVPLSQVGPSPLEYYRIRRLSTAGLAEAQLELR